MIFDATLGGLAASRLPHDMNLTRDIVNERHNLKMPMFYADRDKAGLTTRATEIGESELMQAAPLGMPFGR